MAASPTSHDSSHPWTRRTPTSAAAALASASPSTVSWSVRAMADRLGLAVTGGSDYHGRYKPDIALGTALGDLNVPDDLLDALEARRP